MRRATRTTTVQHFQGGSTGSHVRSSSDHHHSNAESFLMSFSRLKNFSGDWPSDEWGTCWRGGQAQHRQGNSHQHQHFFSFPSYFSFPATPTADPTFPQMTIFARLFLWIQPLWPSRVNLTIMHEYDQSIGPARTKVIEAKVSDQI